MGTSSHRMVLVFVFAVVILRSVDDGWTLLGYSIVFWGIMAYLALPRLHRTLTAIYVPSYFIGRTVTPDGLLGDPVNLAVNGSRDQIHTAMRAAGWTLADPITIGSSWGIVKSSVTRKSYPEAPVSPLLLFGKVQEFAYQQEVDGNAAQRHHIRFWPCPEGWPLPGGHRVQWLAAGTYDRAVGPTTPAQAGRATDRATSAEDVLQDVARRPFSIVAAWALTVLSALALVLDLVLHPGELTSDLELDGEPQGLGVAVVTFMVVLLALMLGAILFLGWRTFQGSQRSRLIMIALVTFSQIFQMIAFFQGGRPTAGALLSASVDLLTVYALTSLSARAWTRGGAERARAEAAG
ncbi:MULTISPECIES: LssY C-terminal domain-containing protein [unclassified Kocuria]|uniref:LssY C-terminal domain-containing protein n=1 Tax=unclassified Kocuria TaxID=2649579 RepID=UPI00383510F4